MAARILARIAEVRRDELDRAVTLVGPHRDDLEIALNDLPARGYASHGESWSLALALRIASAELLRETGVAGDPVVILDDVFAELDERRRGRLLEAVLGFEQVIVTAAVPGDVPELDRARVIRIRAGEVVEEETPDSGGPSTRFARSGTGAQPVPERGSEATESKGHADAAD